MAEREGTANEGSMESTDDLGRTVRSNHMRSNEARGTSPRRGQRSAIGTPTLLLSGAQASEQREQVERRAAYGTRSHAALLLVHAATSPPEWHVLARYWQQLALGGMQAFPRRFYYCTACRRCCGCSA
jgi:hypothetical protein